MKTYKLKIKITSSLGTPPVADTIWGHICWAIRYREGKDALEAFLAAYEGDSPPLLLSDPMPEGFLPVPLLPNFRAQTDKKIAFDTIKKLGKMLYIPADYFKTDKVVDKKTVIEHIYAAKYESDPRIATKAIIAHNTIDRLTGAVLRPDETLPENERQSGLFFTEEYHVDTSNPPVMDVYVLSDYPQERIKQLFEWAFECGYGKYASRGKGRIEVCGIESCNLPQSDKPNAVMLLASCLPAENDPTDGYWQLFIRFGRLGGHFANGSMSDLGIDENLPFKRPITMLKAGSVLKTQSPAAYYGCVKGKVHSVPQIKHYGIAPAIALNCDFGGEQ